MPNNWIAPSPQTPNHFCVIILIMHLRILTHFLLVLSNSIYYQQYVWKHHNFNFIVNHIRISIFTLRFRLIAILIWLLRPKSTAATKAHHQRFRWFQTSHEHRPDQDAPQGFHCCRGHPAPLHLTIQQNKCKHGLVLIFRGTN